MKRKTIDINYLEERLEVLPPEARDRIYKFIDKKVCELYGFGIGAVSGVLAGTVLYPNIDNEGIRTRAAALGLVGLTTGVGYVTGRLIGYFRNRNKED